MDNIFNDKELLDTFKTEVFEHIESLENNIIDLNKNSDDSDLINEIFRSFHTIKGSAHYLNLTDMVNVTHNTENLVDLLRKKEIKISEDITDLLLEALDLIKVFMENFSGRESRDVSDIIEIFFTKLRKYLPNLKIEQIENEAKIETMNGEQKDMIRKFVNFRIHTTLFAFDVDNIIEIIPYQEVTKMPFMEYYIIGLINFRGDLVPLIDLRLKFNSSNDILEATRIIILEHKGSKVGILVDEVFEIVNVPEMEIKKDANIKHNIKNEWIDGIFLYNDNIVIVLNKKKLLIRNIGEKEEEKNE